MPSLANTFQTPDTRIDSVTGWTPNPHDMSMA